MKILPIHPQYLIICSKWYLQHKEHPLNFFYFWRTFSQRSTKKNCITVECSFNTPIMLSGRCLNPLILPPCSSNICRAPPSYQSHWNGLAQATCNCPKHPIPTEQHGPWVKETEPGLNDTVSYWPAKVQNIKLCKSFAFTCLNYH